MHASGAASGDPPSVPPVRESDVRGPVPAATEATGTGHTKMGDM